MNVTCPYVSATLASTVSHIRHPTQPAACDMFSLAFLLYYGNFLRKSDGCLELYIIQNQVYLIGRR